MPIVKTKDDHWIPLEKFAKGRGIEAARLPRSVRILLEAALCGVEAGRANAGDCEEILN